MGLCIISCRSVHWIVIRNFQPLSKPPFARSPSVDFICKRTYFAYGQETRTHEILVGKIAHSVDEINVDKILQKTNFVVDQKIVNIMSVDKNTSIP